MTPRVVVMGVTGCGKTTLGRALADRLGAPFYDGDDYHPPANVAKMRRGDPLDDADRAPWLDRLHDLLAQSNDGAVLACSALKHTYRERLRANGLALTFVHLVISKEAARRRLEARADHYMPPSLVDSQFEALETPTDALAINAELDALQVLAEVVEALDVDRE